MPYITERRPVEKCRPTLANPPPRVAEEEASILRSDRPLGLVDWAFTAIIIFLVLLCAVFQISVYTLLLP